MLATRPVEIEAMIMVLLTMLCAGALIITLNGKSRIKELVMKQTLAKHIHKPTVLPVTVVLLWVSINALMSQDTGARMTASSREVVCKVKIGELAPDFELPILILDKDDSGKPFGKINEDKMIRLSSFFGKRPVCLLMSSYT